MGKLNKSPKKSEPQPPTESSSTFGFHPSHAELYEMGKSLRDKCPRASHAAWQPAADRPDPIVLLEESSKGRIPQLIPVRYGRMMQTPFIFKFMDIAIKVMGVGSVGTWCAVILLMASDTDPLFLQVKEARPSVLEAYAGKSVHPNHGQRVVVGCQLMQSASDIFLGWTEGQLGRQFYIRQLKDIKIKMLVDVFTQSVMLQYADVYGWCLARAHARSGEPAKISGYLGKSDAFDRAIADFSIAYANQSERDYKILMKAVRAGKLEVFIEQEV